MFSEFSTEEIKTNLTNFKTMNPLLLKGLSILKSVGNGVIKPLPLSGIVKHVTEMRETKIDAAKVVKLAAYIISGVIIWGVILGKITADDALKLIQIFGF